MASAWRGVCPLRAWSRFDSFVRSEVFSQPGAMTNHHGLVNPPLSSIKLHHSRLSDVTKKCTSKRSKSFLRCFSFFLDLIPKTFDGGDSERDRDHAQVRKATPREAILTSLNKLCVFSFNKRR